MKIISKLRTPISIEGVIVKPLEITEVSKNLLSNPTFKQLIDIEKIVISGVEKEEEKQSEKFTPSEMALIKKMGVEINENSDYDVTIAQANELKSSYDAMLEELKSAGVGAKGSMSFDTISKMYEDYQNGEPGE